MQFVIFIFILFLIFSTFYRAIFYNLAAKIVGSERCTYTISIYVSFFSYLILVILTVVFILFCSVPSDSFTIKLSLWFVDGLICALFYGTSFLKSLLISMLSFIMTSMATIIGLYLLIYTKIIDMEDIINYSKVISIY